MTTGLIHSYESFGAVDGPGVRFIAFLHGCPFRCVYCHNPDTWASEAAIRATPEEVLARALRYRSYWREEGGITVSGGEPMMQPEFVAELFELAKAKGVTTCIDTAAACFSRGNKAIERMLETTDTVLLDIKHIDTVQHRRITGHGNERVLDCARYLAEKGIAVWIRHVLVPGWTDDDASLAALGEYVRSLGNVKRVDILPYHTMGETKWQRLGLDYPLKGVLPPSEDAIARATASLR